METNSNTNPLSASEPDRHTVCRGRKVNNNRRYINDTGLKPTNLMSHERLALGGTHPGISGVRVTEYRFPTRGVQGRWRRTQTPTPLGLRTGQAHCLAGAER